ncbi:MAG: signal peptidase I [Actinomycetia bacterium]|nr:signal peptidase I [Actinomycetes bacterium]
MQPLIDRPFTSRWSRAKPWMLPVVLSLVVLAAIFVGVTFVVFDMVTVPDDANREKISKGDHIMVNTRSTVDLGELIVFERPGADTISIGRVVAAGADLVQVGEGGLLLNGVPVAEPYLLGDDPGPPIDPFSVPDGSVFVLADDRRHQAIETMGLVPLDLVVGTVSFRFWPLGG